MIREWFEEYLNSGKGKAHRIDDDSEFIIYKGFKILRDGEKYTITDGRFSDLYTRVNPSDMMRLAHYGFMQGCDLIKYRRDQSRLDKHRTNLDILKEEREFLETLGLPTTSREYKKRNNKIIAAEKYHKGRRDYYLTKMIKIEVQYNLEAYESKN